MQPACNSASMSSQQWMNMSVLSSFPSHQRPGSIPSPTWIVWSSSGGFTATWNVPSRPKTPLSLNRSVAGTPSKSLNELEEGGVGPDARIRGSDSEEKRSRDWLDSSLRRSNFESEGSGMAAVLLGRAARRETRRVTHRESRRKCIGKDQICCTKRMKTRFEYGSRVAKFQKDLLTWNDGLLYRAGRSLLQKCLRLRALPCIGVDGRGSSSSKIDVKEIIISEKKAPTIQRRARMKMMIRSNKWVSR